VKELTKKEIEIIRGEKRIAYVFSLLLFFAGALFGLVYYLVSGIDFLFIVISLLAFGLCILIPSLMNRDYNKDIQSGIKLIEIGQIQDKECNGSYEAGSGNLYIPVLGNLFPKLWGSHPKHSLLCYLIINNIRYRAEEEVYNKVNTGDGIEMYFTTDSHLLIGFGECIKRDK